MESTTLLIIILIVLLVGGGGWYGRGRWFWGLSATGRLGGEWLSLHPWAVFGPGVSFLIGT
jgi:hypothetical protein